LDISFCQNDIGFSLFLCLCRCLSSAWTHPSMGGNSLFSPFCETWSDTKLEQWTSQITLSEIGIALQPRKSDILRNYKCENPLPLVNSATVDQDSPRLNQSPIFIFILHVSLSSCTALHYSRSSLPSAQITFPRPGRYFTFKSLLTAATH
jgi:hypothetical protein